MRYVILASIGCIIWTVSVPRFWRECFIEHNLSQRNRPLIVTVNSTKDYGHSPNNQPFGQEAYQMEGYLITISRKRF